MSCWFSDLTHQFRDICQKQIIFTQLQVTFAIFFVNSNELGLISDNFITLSMKSKTKYNTHYPIMVPNGYINFISTCSLTAENVAVEILFQIYRENSSPSCTR